MTHVPARPPFDPDIERALHQHREIIVTSMTREDIPRVRSLGADVAPVAAPTHGGFERHDLVAPGQGSNPDVPVIVLIPAHVREPMPVLVFLHGGGMIAGTAESDLDLVAKVAFETGCAIASAEYRLAPEHPYPAASDDALAVLDWVQGGHAPAAIDPHRAILSGISAGGGLAAAVALRHRDLSRPKLGGLLLLCPMLDYRSNSPSATQMLGAGSWDATANATAWAAYIGDAEPSPYASAALADDLSGLPPIFMDVGSAETFRDECVTFASRVWQAGGDAELHVWPGGAHAFDALAPWALMSQAARDARTAWLRRLLSRHPATHQEPS